MWNGAFCSAHPFSGSNPILRLANGVLAVMILHKATVSAQWSFKCPHCLIPRRKRPRPLTSCICHVTRVCFLWLNGLYFRLIQPICFVTLSSDDPFLYYPMECLACVFMRGRRDPTLRIYRR